MIGVAIEHWSLSKYDEILTWLETNFGPEDATTYYVDYDHDLWTLMMSEKISSIFYLRWS